MAQYLDNTGLITYDELIKNYIDTGDEPAIKVVSLSRDGASIEFYTQTPGFGVSAAYSIEFPVTDISNLMSLVSGAVANDIAIFDRNGQVYDSGTLLSDLATMAYVGTIPNGYNATTIAEYAKELADNVAANGYDDTALKEQVESNTSAIETLNGDENTNGSVAKAVADAKEELTEAIGTAVANAGHLKREIVMTLPNASSADTLTIYLVRKSSGSETQNVYDEYMVINGAWEKIGDTAVDLTDYAKTEYVDSVAASTLSDAESYADSLASNYDAAGTAQALVTGLAEGQVATNTSDIASLTTSITNIEESLNNIEAIPDSDIEALFN